MPKKPETVQELYQALKKSLSKSPEHRALLRSIEAVNAYTEGLRKRDRYKRIPYVTAAQQQVLMDLHKAVAEAAKAVAAIIKDGPDKAQNAFNGISIGS